MNVQQNSSREGQAAARLLVLAYRVVFWGRDVSVSDELRGTCNFVSPHYPLIQQGSRVSCSDLLSWGSAGIFSMEKGETEAQENGG